MDSVSENKEVSEEFMDRLQAGFWLNDFEVTPHLNQIVCGDQLQVLQPKILNVLVLLASRPNHVFSKEEILSKVWTKNVVSDEVLTNAIWVLRNALGDNSRAPTYIQTVPRKGYRLLVCPEFVDTVVPKKTSLSLKFMSSATLILGLVIGAAWLYTPIFSDGITFNASPFLPQISDSEKEKKVWSFKTGGAILDVLLNDSLVITVSADNFVYAHYRKTGKELWRTRVNDASQVILSSDGESVIVTAKKDYVYALDITNGLERWRFFTNAHQFSRTQIHQQHVVIGDRSGFLFRLNQSSGKLISKVEVANAIQSHLVLDEFESVVMDRYGNMQRIGSDASGWQKSFDTTTSELLFGENNILYFSTWDGFVYAIDAVSGNDIWRAPIKGRLWSPLVISDLVISVSSRGYAVAFNKVSGERKWTIELEARPTQFMVVNDQLWLAAQNKRLYVYQLDTGKLMDMFKTSSPITVFRQTREEGVIGLQSGEIFYASDYATLLHSSNGFSKVVSRENFGVERASEQFNPEVIWRVRTQGVVDSSSLIEDDVIYYGDDESVYARNAQSGDLIWTFNLGDDMGTQVVSYHGRVYFGTRSGYLYCLDKLSGKEVWRFKAGADIISTPHISAELIYFGSQDHHLYAIDVNSGAERWRFKAGHMINGGVSVNESFIYFGSGDNFLYALNKHNGQLIWKQFVESWTVDTPLLVGKKLIVGSDEGKLFAFDPFSGEPYWQFQTHGRIWYEKSTDGENVFVGSGDHFIYAINLESGKEVWRHQTGSDAKYSTQYQDGIVYASSEDGVLYALNHLTGEVNWRFFTQGQLRNVSVSENYVTVASTDFYLYVLRF